MSDITYKYKTQPESAVDIYNRIKAESAYRKQQKAQQEAERQALAYAQQQEAAALQEQAQQKAQEEQKNKGGFLGGLGYVGEQIGLGLLRGIEGIWDFAAGGIADLFGADEWAEKQVANDWVNYNHANEWYNPGTGWEFAGQVGQGVGQMLPSIAVSAIPGAGPALGTGVFMAGAAGNSVADAYRTTGELGAKEWLYGTGSGILEGAIEKVSGGIGGTKLGTVLGKKVANSTAGKLATTFVGEGLEEVASDLIDPTLRRITGVDPNAQVDVSQLPNTFLVGGTTGAVLGGASRVANAKRAGGFNNLNAMEAAQEIRSAQAKGDSLQAKGKLTESWAKTLGEKQAETAVKLSERLKKMSPESRSSLIENNNLSYLFNADGSMKEAPKATYNKDAYSYSLQGREDTLKYQPTTQALTDTQKAVVRNVEKMSGGKVKTVIAENLTADDGTRANALYKDGVMYIDRNANAAEVEAVHEMTHSLEGTEAYNKYANFIFKEIQSSPELTKRYGEFLARHQATAEAYSGQTQNMDAQRARYVVQTELVSQYTADMFGNEEFIRRLSKSEPNVAQRLWQWIKDKIKVLTSKGGDRETIAFLQKAEKLYRKALSDSVGGVKLSELQFEDEAETEDVAPAKATPAEVRMSIQRAVGGKNVVVIEDNILEGVPKKDYAKVVRQAMRKFEGGIPVSGRLIKVNAISRNEYTQSKNTQYYKGSDNTLYVDKMKAGGQLDEIVLASTNYVNEGLNHPRKDNFKEFARGLVYFQIGDRQYSAKPIIGFTGKEMVFYDLVDMKTTKFNIKKDSVKASGKIQNTFEATESSDKSIAQNSASVNSVREKSGNSDETRYSLKLGEETIEGSIEETRDLVALHNLSEDKLLKVLDLGGFPMPSIAVTKSSMTHNEFGDITVVFGKDTIDPQTDRRNKVYQKDAWTPTVPSVEYKPNERILEKIKKKHHDLARQVGYDAARPLYNFANDMERELQNHGGEIGLIMELYDNTDVMNLFLADTGKGSVEQIYKETKSELSEGEKEYRARLVSALGKDFLAKWKEAEGLSARKEFVSAHKDTIVNAMASVMQGKESIEETRENISKNFSVFALGNTLNQLTSYIENGGVTVRSEFDSSATQEAIRKATPKQEYIKWIDNLFGGIEEKAGIYNGKDPYTSSGNRRSFEALHYEYTLNNIVEAMLDSDEKGGSSWHGLTLGQLQAKLAKEFKSVDEIRENAKFIVPKDEKAYEEFSETSRKMLEEITNEMVDEGRFGGDSVSYWSSLDGAQMVVGEIADKKLFTLEKIAAFMKKEYSQSYRYNDSIGNKILGLFEYVRGMNNTDYFEAKPRRAVGFDEIKSVLLPENSTDKIKQRLDSMKIPYTIYGETGADRTAAIQKLDDVRFSLPIKDSEGRELTPEQREFFRNSKVVDENGKLRPVYHGTRNPSFTVFKQSGGDSALGAGMYFAENEEYAKGYSFGSKPYQVYLNITNPYIAKMPGGIVQSKLIKKGYDGVYNPSNKFWVAFSPNQIKLTTNKTPTSDADIRYSLANDGRGQYNGKKNGEDENGRERQADDLRRIQGRGLDTGASGGSVRGMASLRERVGRAGSERIAKRINELVERSKRLDKYTEDLAREYAKNIGYDLYFAKLTDSKRDYFREGEYLFVSDDVTADDFGRILDRFDPVNRNTEAGKTAHISAERWKKFLDLHGDGDVFVAKIPIQDFLDLTADRLAQRDIREQTAPLDVSDLKASDQLYLKIDFESGKVLDHEGRHRLTALLNAGYQNADVMILAENADSAEYDRLVVRPQENAGDEPVVLFNIVSATRSETRAFASFQYQVQRDPDIRYSLKPDGTKILTEIPVSEQTRKEKARDLWTNFQVHFSDEQAGVVKAGKKLGVADIDAKTHFARAAYNAAGSMLDEYQTDRSGNRVGDGFKAIWDPVYEKGDTYRHDFYEYLLQYQNIDRLAQGKEVFADTSVEDSKKDIAELAEKHPEFPELAKKVWKYSDNLLQLRVDMGLISQEAADAMREMYPHYVPTFRDMKGTQGVGGLSGKYNLAVKTTIKTAKGSTLDILPPDVIIARQTMEVMRAGRVNELIRSLYDVAEAKGEFTDLSVVERKPQYKKAEQNATENAETGDELYELLETDYSTNDNKNNQVTFFKDGERITLAVTPEVFAGINAYSPNVEYRNKLIEAVAKGNNTFKKLVTSANPFFLVRNFLRDLQEALFYSKHGTRRFLGALGRAYKQIATNGELWQKYKALGGLSSGLFDYNTGVKRETGIKARAQGVLGKLEWANMFIEQAPRLAEFMLSVEKGATAEQALLDSADVTTNFSRGGKTAKFLNRTVMPFLNPSIQGWSKLVRTIFSKKSATEWGKLILKALILGVGLTYLNDLLNGDDDDYKALSMRDKENYYLFKVGDTFLKLPKGRVLSVFGSLYLRGKESAEGNANAWDGYLSSVASQVSPVDNMTRTIFSPFTDAATNTTWYGGQIEGRKFDNTAPKDRYDESTSSIAIALGKLLNYSPKKIHYVIDQYSGIIGDIVLPMTTKKAERGVFLSNFTVDPALNNRWSDDFYTALDEANYAKTAGDLNSAYVVRYLNSVAGEVSDMYATKQQIEASDKAKGDKASESKAIQLLINETQKKAVEGMKMLQTELTKINPAEAIERLKKSAAYREFGTLGQEKSLQRLNDYYYAVALNKAFGTELEEKYQLYSLFDDSVFAYLTAISTFESDKDEDGNTITGSRKKKVFAYINKLPISAAQKYVLMGLAGYKNEKGQSQVESLIRSKVKDRNAATALLEASGY